MTEGEKGTAVRRAAAATKTRADDREAFPSRKMGQEKGYRHN
jgi:hypothetical protein